MDKERLIQCPVCGSPLEPVALQEGLYDCPNCGEVEEDDEGFIVNGRFYGREITERDGFGELESDGDSADEFDNGKTNNIGSFLAGLMGDLEDFEDIDIEDGELDDFEEYNIPDDESYDDFDEDYK